MKKIMILGGGILQLPGIEQAKKMGLDVVVADMNPDAIGFSVPDVHREIVSTIDTPAVLEAARRHQIDGIMTLASDMPMRTIATVAKELGLVGIDEQTAMNTTNKAEMRRCLYEHGVPVPRFFRVADETSLLAAYKTFSGKAIVKPADNSGSRGVVQLPASCDEKTLLEAYAYSKQSSRCGDVVLEEFMEGAEVSVESVTVNGECHVIQITDKLTTGAPYFVEMGHSQPSALPPHVKEAIADVARRATKAVGIQNGPAHTEIIVTAEGPKIVELGARLGGDNITTHLVPLSTGVNMVECCIRIALGMEPDVLPKQHCGSAIRYIQNENGVIRSIDGVKDAEQTPHVQQVSVVHGVGETVGEIKSSVDRVGFVIAQADTAVAAVTACEKALDRIHILYE